MMFNKKKKKKNRISGHFNGLGPKPAPPYPTHHLNPDIHHMCGCSGKMNSAGEYMLRKFIAHAWDEPSGATVEVEVEGEIFPLSTGPVSIILGRTVSQNIQVSLV